MWFREKLENNESSLWFFQLCFHKVMNAWTIKFGANLEKMWEPINQPPTAKIWWICPECDFILLACTQFYQYYSFENACKLFVWWNSFKIFIILGWLHQFPWSLLMCCSLQKCLADTGSDCQKLLFEIWVSAWILWKFKIQYGGDVGIILFEMWIENCKKRL